MADEPGDEPPAEEPKYDQAFFLDLAAKGKDAWNAWRRDPAHKDVHVTFAGTYFSEAPRDRIDFSGFEFGDHADFSRCKWWGVRGYIDAFLPGRASFTGASFGDYAIFDDTAFSHQATFAGATFGFGANFDRAAFGFGANFHRAAFGNGASFAGAAFGGWAIFASAAFGDGASLIGAAFGANARFTGTPFGDHANFTGTAFGDLANFAGAAFGYDASFDRTAFGDYASFAGVAFGNLASFAGAAFGGGANFDTTVFKGRVEFTGKPKEQLSKELEANADEKDKDDQIALKKRLEDSWQCCGSGPDRFLAISFARARFDDEAIFSGRSFEQTAEFTNARFYYPPDFDAATKDARIDFTGAYIGFGRPLRLHWTSKTKVPFRLRALRKIAEETKNHDFERDLYIEERKAERDVYLVQRFKDWVKDPKRKWALIAHLLWIAVMGLYWALADYGRSFARPAAWLIASGFFFYWRYLVVLAQLMAKAPDIDKYKQAVRMLALGNAVPFVGPLTIDGEIKKFLFCLHDTGCSPIPPEGFQWLVLGQNLLSITLVFFIGLALRNYFKIK